MKEYYMLACYNKIKDTEDKIYFSAKDDKEAAAEAKELIKSRRFNKLRKLLFVGL